MENSVQESSNLAQYFKVSLDSFDGTIISNEEIHAAEILNTALQLRKKYQEEIGRNDINVESHIEALKSATLTNQEGVFNLMSDSKELFKFIPFGEFVADLETFTEIEDDRPTLSFSKQRLEYLQIKRELWGILNDQTEKEFMLKVFRKKFKIDLPLTHFFFSLS